MQLNLPEVEERDGSEDMEPGLDIELADQDEDDALVEENADAVDHNDLPVLYPEGEEEVSETEDSEAEELAVSEWPAPIG